MFIVILPLQLRWSERSCISDQTWSWTDYRNSDQRSVVTHYDSRDHPRTQLSGESKAETPVRALKEGSAFRKKLAWLFFACSAVVLAVVWPTKVAPALSHFLPKSMLGEQCSRVWIKSNLTQLRNSLDENVFGQHVAVRQVLAALHRRWDNANKADGASMVFIHNNKYWKSQVLHPPSSYPFMLCLGPEKPLVFSFHGWTGSGKNYMAKFIAEALFDRGLSSKYVHFLSSTLHFEDHSHRMVSTYQVKYLTSLILGLCLVSATWIMLLFPAKIYLLEIFTRALAW